MGALVALVGPPEPASAQLLEGGTEGLILQANDFQCGLRSDAGTCAALDDSPTDPGGVWPTGSPNAYMFNSGIMVATIIGEDGGPWAGDTVGAYFFNASGPGIAAPVTNIWNSLNPVDIANWPQAGAVPEFPFLSAYVTDEELYSDVLLGRQAASQQDSWLVYWDGDPGLQSGRPHPAGLLVEQRTHAWNYPAGNEGTLYFVYHITNVSDNEFFQRQNENRFFGGEDRLPNGGWTLEDVYMSYAADPDVTADARQNFASAILPFNMGIVWKSDFLAAEFQYPPAIFHPPFFTNAPGIIGTKYLKSPLNLGLSLFSVYTNGGVFSDPSGSQQLHRYLSGNLNPDLGDPECTVQDPVSRRLCYFNSAQTDVRYYQASGPFSIEPGETVTVVSAMFAAATVNVPGITQGGQNPPTVLDPVDPSLPVAPSIHPGCHGDPITAIEQAAGWVETLECPPEGQLVDQFDVAVVDESLLHKAQVAQTIFDNQFLLPFAPEPPAFYVVPGDGQVTVVWEPTLSEETGDPFFEVAGDEESPLFNPNFRQFDVEGYRIYRSQDGTNFNLIAQFDKAGTVFTDVLCETDPDFAAGVDECDQVREIPITGRLVQYAPGDVVRLSSGESVVLAADSAPPGRFPAMGDTGLPFAYVDQSVRNGFEYYYRVTAFDVNSLTSGPSSLESASLPAKTVIPQPLAAGNVGADSVQAQVSVVLGDGTVLDPTDNQTINPTTGVFSGPPPPTDALSGVFQAIVPDLLAASDQPVIAMTLDSVTSAYYSGAYYFSDNAGQVFVVGSPAASGLAGFIQAGSDSLFTDIAGPATTASDPAKRDSLEALGVNAPPVAGHVFVELEWALPQWQSGDADWAWQVCGFWAICPPAESHAGGSRWFDGTTETLADPTIGTAHGELAGVTEIFQPVYGIGLAAYENPVNGANVGGDIMRRFFQTTWAVRRVADIRFDWQGPDASPEVFDVTHQVSVPFKPATRASYGFLTDADGDGVLTFGDFYFIPGLETAGNIGNISANMPVELVPEPVLMQVDVDGDLEADGTGFAMYVAGEPYIFQTASVPAAGTTWTFRTHSGVVTAPGAGGPYAHVDDGVMRTPGVPGLRIAASVTGAATFFEDLIDLADIRVAPDPYYGASLFDFSPAARNIRFLNLPPQASIRIYSVSGVLVDVLNHESNEGGSLASWDLRNRSGQMVASGVYFYHVTTPFGQEHTGKFTVIHSGLAR